MAGRPITIPRPDKTVIQKLIRRNLSQDQIAVALDASRANLRRWLKHYDLKTNIAATQKRPRATPEQCAMIFRLRDAGLGHYSIAKRVGVGVRAVNRAIKTEVAEALPEPVRYTGKAPRTSPSAFALWCANPFGQAVENVAECV